MNTKLFCDKYIYINDVYNIYQIKHRYSLVMYSMSILGQITEITLDLIIT